MIGALEACKHIPLPTPPRLEVVDVLYSEKSTTQQKVGALKSIMSSSGQALALLVLAVALFQVGATIIHILEILFWPIVVPFKILGWIAGSA